MLRELSHLISSRSQSRMLRAGALLLAAAALAWTMHGVSWDSFTGLFVRLDWRWIALAVFFDVLSYVSQGLRWRMLLDRLGVINVWQTTQAIYAGLFLNEVAPLRAGEALRCLLVAKSMRRGIGEILPTMLTERLMDALWLAAGLIAITVWLPLPHEWKRASWLFLAVLLSLAIVMMAAVALRRRSRAAPSGLREKVYAGIEAALKAFRNRPALLASLGLLVSQGLAFWSVLRACHLSLGVAAGVAVMLVVRLGTLLPAAPANLGTHQLSTVLGLSLFGVPKTLSAPASMIVFAVLTLPLWLIGMAAIATARTVQSETRGDIAGAA